MAKDTPEDWGPLAGPWRRYRGNPVSVPGPRERHVGNGPQSVVFFQGKWRMFVMCLVDGEQNTILLESDDGLHWERAEPYPVLKVTEDYEGTYALVKSAVVVDDELRLYYFGKLGIEERLCLAVTSDLKTIRKHELNPLFTVKDSRLEGERVFPDSVVRTAGGWFHYYDIGFDYRHPLHPRTYLICAAVSEDGIHICDADRNPMVARGQKGAWDDAMVSQAAVARIGDWWYMLYSGASSRREGKDGQSFGLARAGEPLGPWQKYPHNPVFTPAADDRSWDGRFVQHPCPVLVKGRWCLYYNGHGAEPLSYKIGTAFCDRRG